MADFISLQTPEGLPLIINLDLVIAVVQNKGHPQQTVFLTTGTNEGRVVVAGIPFDSVKRILAKERLQ